MARAGDNVTLKIQIPKKYLNELILFAFAFLLYANSIPNNYNLDDELVTNQQRLTSQGIIAIPEIFVSSYFQDDAGRKYEYRPVELTSFAIEHSLFGDNPHVSHFINVILYSLLCVLLYIVLKRLFISYSRLLLFLSVLLFIAHPTHTEVVASIKNRDEIFALAFVLLAIHACLLAIDFNRLWILAFPFLIILALLSKFSIIPVCLAIPLLILFSRKITSARYFGLAALNTVIILFTSPFSSFHVQLYYLAGCTLLYTSVYVLVRGRYSVLKTAITVLLNNVVNYLKKKPNPPVSKRKPVQIIKPAHRAKWISGVCGIAGVVLMLLTWYIYFRFSSWMVCIPVVVLLIIYSVVNNYNRQIITSFIITTVAVIAFFLRDYDRLLGFSLVILLLLHMHDNSKLKLYGFKILLAFVFILLFPHNDIKLLFPFFLFPGKWQKWGIIFLIPVSFLLIIKPLVEITTQHQWADDLTLGIVIFWVLYFGFRRGLSYQKAYNYILYLLPVFLLITIYDEGNNSVFFVVKHAPQNYYVWPNSGLKPLVTAQLQMVERNIADKLDNTKHKSEAAKYKLAEASERLIQAKNNFKNELEQGYSQTINNIISEGTYIDSKGVKRLKERKPVSAVGTWVASTDRPVLFVEQPITQTDALAVRIASGSDLMRKFLQLTICPYPLSFYYGYKEIKPIQITEPKAIFAISILAIIFFVACFYVRKGEIVAWCIILYLIVLSPYCSFLIPVPGAFADRFLFFPVLFFALILCWVLVKQSNGSLNILMQWKALKTYQQVTFGAILITFCMLTLLRNMQWKDPLTLMRHDIVHIDESAQAHNLLAANLNLAAENTNDSVTRVALRLNALSNYKRSIEIYPSFFNAVFDAGRTYMQLNMPDSAITFFKAAAALNPGFIVSQLNLADIYFSKGRWDEGIFYANEAIRISPNDYDGYDKLSYAYFILHEFDKSIAVNKKAMTLMPQNALPLINISRTFLGVNNRDSALYYLETASHRFPENQTVKNLLTKSK